MQSQKTSDRKVVFTSGTFDMFHSNHLRMLEYASGLGDVLVVGVNTDELVASYKNPPIIPFEERISILRALRAPDVVIPQHSLDHRDKVKKLNMDIFVVGDDWTGKFDYLDEMGVQVFYFPYGMGVSSTELKARIVKRYKALLSEAETHAHPDSFKK
jgi:choline-phosphate cytidylyltransferase/glycerol-3-phosphate cytidylyltransferase